MMLYSDRCEKCGHFICRTSNEEKYCSFCGARLKDLPEPQQITCPCCKGTGKVDPWQMGKPYYGAIVMNDPPMEPNGGQNNA